MQKNKIFILLFILFCNFFVGYSAENYTLKGVVKDSLTQESMPEVYISIVELNYWTISDSKGSFEIRRVPKGTYTLLFRILGYKEQIIKTTIHSDKKNLAILLQQSSLGLKEVVVTATESKLGSSSTIKSEAIQHIQPKSLTDIFQLLPGQITHNPKLSSPGQISIRDIGKNTATSAGALLLIDGIPVSNDANMQIYSTAKSGLTTKTPGTLGGSIDTRDVSAENIESAEIIRGIPSAEYGNLTSGVVIIKTKIGKTPWRASLKADPNTKIVSLNKGFKLSDNGGILQIGGDYTEAYNDLRKKFEGYKRLTANMGYSNTWFKATSPLSANYKLAYYQTIDEDKTDPELKRGEVIKSSKKGLRMGLSGKWMLRKSWLTNLQYSFSGSYAEINDFNRQLLVIASGAVPFPTSYTGGEFSADYLPGVFYTEYTMNGKPYHFGGKIKADLTKQWKKLTNKVIAGIEYSLSGNSGAGLSYDLATPPMSVLSSSIRPRKFSDIPALQNSSVFVENKLTLPIGKTELTLLQGFRITNAQPSNSYSVEPRTLLNYEVLNRKNNSFLDRLSLNFGYGIATKMPSLVYLSPNKAYFDEVSFNYLDKGNSLAVVTTDVIEDTRNPYLKPAINKKKEVGFDFKVGQVQGIVTFYHEKLTDILSFTSRPYVHSYRKYQVNGAGKNPIYENGNVYYFEGNEKKVAPFVMDTVIDTYKYPTNNGINIKKGVEYSINLGKIKMLRSSFVLDGAWVYDERTTTSPSLVRQNILHKGKRYPYVAMMPAGKKTIHQRFNTNVRTITHIPELKLVFSLTTQIIWTDRVKYRWENEDGVPYPYYYNEAGEKIGGNESVYDNMEATRYINPIGFIDKKGVVHQWKEEYSSNAEYIPMISSSGSNYYYVEEILPPALQFNLRMTKEFTKNLTLSFMANNFLKMNPYQKSNRHSGYIQRNGSLYFGAEINYRL